MRRAARYAIGMKLLPLLLLLAAPEAWASDWRSPGITTYRAGLGLLAVGLVATPIAGVDIVGARRCVPDCSTEHWAPELFLGGAGALALAQPLMVGGALITRYHRSPYAPLSEGVVSVGLMVAGWASLAILPPFLPVLYLGSTTLAAAQQYRNREALGLTVTASPGGVTVSGRF